MGPTYTCVTLAIISCIIPLTKSQHRRDCSREEYNRCVALADPLLKEPHLVFPDNMADIELVCLTWNQFVDCLKSYTDRCFTPQQRRQFNKAVENPIESVHQMCTQRSYQQEYLQHAGCIKSTVTQHEHCGDQYTQLVQQVQQGDAISRASLCCSHDRFKKCVMKEAKKVCDGGQNNGQAVRFAGQIIDKALSFLQDQCYNYIPNSGDCSAQRKSSDDQMSMSTASWPPSNQGNQGNPSTRLSGDLATLSTGVSPLEVSVSNPGMDRDNSPGNKVTDVSWMPSHDEERESTWRKEVTREPQGMETSGGMLGSRTRPSSYGRSSSWDTPIPTSPSNWGTPSPPERPSRPDWATISTWNVQNTMGNPETTFRRQADQDAARATTETWYPAAGSQVGNEVDEPNQLGLSKPKNSGTAKRYIEIAVIMIISLVFLV